MSIISLAIISFFAWVVSTLAGGGSPFILIPLVNVMLGTAAVPPVITIGMFLGNAHRISLFWRHIDWKLTFWYAPGAIVGAILGAYTFTQIHLEWLQLLIGVFLIVSVCGFAIEKKSDKNPEADLKAKTENLPSQPRLKAWYILPAGFLKAFVSGLVGTTGPVLNPFYLGYGLVKEQLIATKAIHMVIIHLVKIITYGIFGVLSAQNIGAGLVIGLVAIPANFLGKYILENHMNAQQFRQLVLTSMVVSGIWLLWGQRDLISLWL
ncbi:sulfite exporter TauE/SafE family protein [Tumidithrix elongata RA019]|uniref:Probable membrane transporter protein n=1 Tax=Tumidithrix elongata BACA0141 TaxID=2716417 RepID=A0AAW9PVE8_9CYAN|nr:sulfite exporter TauE/SafE family protein [Tumidithrix elongata RA019]